MNQIKFRSKSYIFHPIQTVESKHEIDEITNKAVPIAITQVTQDFEAVTDDLKGSGMEQSVLHAFKHPAGKFHAEDSAAVGQTSLYREKEDDKNLPSSSTTPKKLKSDEIFSGQGCKKAVKGKKKFKHQLRII